MQTAITTAATSTALSPEQLTAAIRHEHEAASTAARSALGHALEAGSLLAEAKRKIPHGSWEAYVRDECGIAPRTARLYQRLHRHRDRLPNRQHDAELSVRQAARLLRQPRAKVPAVAAEPAGELRLRVPEWYRAGHFHNGRHPSGWIFNVWPHPSGEPWVHAVTLDPIGNSRPDGNMIAAGPKHGVRIDAVLRVLGMQTTVNGMPLLADPAWKIERWECDPRAIVEGPDWNPFLFTDQEDYCRRGLGIETRQAAGAGA
jgi:hypothetical protein